MIALISVVFCVLIWIYRSHINTQSNALDKRISPLTNITDTLLRSSWSNDDSLIRSRIAASAAQISWLDVTPEITNELSRYISNMYTVAWAWDAARAALPETHDRDALFTRGTIDLLETNALLSWDVLALYSWRQTIQEAIDYLSWASMSTYDKEEKNMSVKQNKSIKTENGPLKIHYI